MQYMGLETNFWKHSSVHIAIHQISPSPSNQAK